MRAILPSFRMRFFFWLFQTLKTETEPIRCCRALRELIGIIVMAGEWFVTHVAKSISLAVKSTGQFYWRSKLFSPRKKKVREMNFHHSVASPISTAFICLGFALRCCCLYFHFHLFHGWMGFRDAQNGLDSCWHIPGNATATVEQKRKSHAPIGWVMRRESEN